MNAPSIRKLAAGVLLACGATVAHAGPPPLWQATFVPCSLALCGNIPDNVATLSLRRGEVTVAARGIVRIRLVGLTYIGSTAPLANKTLEVWAGSYTTGVFEGGAVNPLGTITTDASGNYLGSVDTGGGVPFRYGSGETVSVQFTLNEPSVRSEFITRFKVP